MKIEWWVHDKDAKESPTIFHKITREIPRKNSQKISQTNPQNDFANEFIKRNQQTNRDQIPKMNSQINSTEDFATEITKQ